MKLKEKPAITGGILLLLVTFGLFSGVLDNRFLDEWDDGLYMTYNASVNSGFSYANIITAFTVPVAMNWHPVTMLSHMLDAELFGMHPMYHHLTSLLIHCVNTLLVYLFFLRGTGKSGASLFLALIFGVHPLHVESVAWVSERKDVLSSFFVLAAMNAYINFISSRGVARLCLYLLILLLYLLGLMSKSMVITFPFLLLLLDYWPLERDWKNRLAVIVGEKVPMILFSVVFVLITFSTQKANLYRFKDSLYNTLYGVKMYLFKFFVPYRLCYYYDFIENYSDSSLIYHMIAVLSVVALFILFLKRSRGDNRFVVFGMAWFIISLLPASGIVSFGYQSHADRYMYLPIIGFAAVTCFAIEKIGKRWLIFLSLPIACWAYVTYSYEKSWNDENTLYSNKLKLDPDNVKTNFRMGNYYLGRNLYLSLQYFQRVTGVSGSKRASTDVNFVKDAALGSAVIYSKNRDFQNVIFWLKDFFSYDLDANPQYVRAFDILKDSFAGLGENEKARMASELGIIYRKLLQKPDGGEMIALRQKTLELLR